jgi:hypothetical protein
VVPLKFYSRRGRKRVRFAHRFESTMHGGGSSLSEAIDGTLVGRNGLAGGRDGGYRCVVRAVARRTHEGEERGAKATVDSF